MEPKQPTSFRLSAEAIQILEELTKHLGIGRAAVMEIALRDYKASRANKSKKSKPKS